jgi:hypothetical protein
MGALELDIVTCHHGEYYKGNPAYEDAPDTEEPVPVVFPAVVPGHVFTFALVPLRHCPTERLKRAREWLAAGLETFGLGAKTNAGYGWFDDVTSAVGEKERAAKELADREAVRAALTPDEAFLARLRAMKESDIRGQINPFATEEKFWTERNERVQMTLLYFLMVAEPDLLAADRGNPKSKIAKALANLSSKFPNIG